MSKKVITFGTWEGKPIEWLVLKEDEFQALVISKEKIASNSLSWSGTWESCNFRRWLNKAFWDKAFNNDEKINIVNTYLSDADCKDNVFNLSKAEVEQLMTNSERDIGDWWYTRTPSSNSYMYLMNYNSSGSNSCSYSIRPAMYVLSEVLYK